MTAGASAGSLDIVPSRSVVIKAEFPAKPDESAARAALGLDSETGTVQGDMSLVGNCLEFRPLDELSPAMRYEVRLEGDIPLEDGRKAKCDLLRSFCALRAPPGPALLSVEPSDGAVVEPGVKMVLAFSEAMDQASVEGAFSLSPDSSARYEWSADGSAVTVVAANSFVPLTVYDWSISAKARAKDGAFLRSGRTGSFSCMGDTLRPSVLSAMGAETVAGIWTVLPGATSLDGIESGQGIMITCSENVTPDSMRSAITLSPALSGTVEVVDGTTCVYVPQKAFLPGQDYSIVIKGLVDDSGLSQTLEWRRNFTPLADWLALAAFTPMTGQGDGQLRSNGTLVNGARYGVTLLAATGDEFSFTLEFSDAFASLEDKIAAYRKIDLNAFFPASLPSATLRTVDFPDNRSIHFVYSGLSHSTAEGESWYCLRLTGGESGLRSAAGISGRWLKDDFVIYLVTDREDK